MKRASFRTLRLQVDGAVLEGRLAVPPAAPGVVVLVDGGWGIRYASRETRIAGRFEAQGLGTLLVDLSSAEEDRDRSNRFAVGTLSERLAGVTEWLARRERTAGMDVGLFGVGAGGATAVATAGRDGADVGAVVTLDGRFDPVEEGTGGVPAPTLFVVEGDGGGLAGHNRAVRRRLPGDHHRCSVVRPDGGGSGGGSAAVPLAGDWFGRHLDGRYRVDGDAVRGRDRPGRP